MSKLRGLGDQTYIQIEEYRPEIEYITGDKNIVADALSLLPNIVNQDATHELTYTTETTSGLYYINELPNGTFPLSLKLIYRYQREDPFLLEKPECAHIKRVHFADAVIL